MKSSLKTILALAGLTIGSFALASSQPAKAASAISGTTDCPSSGNSSAISSDCYATPDQLSVTFYEMGFCTSDPLATDTVDLTIAAGEDPTRHNHRIDLEKGEHTYKVKTRAIIVPPENLETTMDIGVDASVSVDSACAPFIVMEYLIKV